ncbi:hypothetical protein EDD21DRAFT_243866 [Dissophora ornata]|nr:hypothetical protein EDD21DRAFT_243866 [Dissophora ornata]
MAQGRKESMHEAYKMAEQGGEAAMRLQEENAMLQTRLSDLGAVARKAIHEEYYTTETLIESLETENQGLREMLGVAEGRSGAVTGPLHFHTGSNGSFADEDADDDGVRQAGNRVSFPSTGTGSYLASSGSDQEQPRSEARRLPLTVQTGLRTPVSSTTSPRSTSSFSPSSTASPTSPSWSSNSSTPSELVSPLPFGSDEQFKSISPPLDDVEGQADAKQKYQRGKITINTKLGSPKAGRAT